MDIATLYTGPECPRCHLALTKDWIRSGALTCPYCNGAFEARVFTPPRRTETVTPQMTMAGPEGANACANHARNAAVTSCQRCGLFICALCEMNIGTGSYCPSCFDRVRNEGTLQAARRYRDYAAMARTAMLAGLVFSLMFLGVPFGGATVYYSIRALKQRREEGRSRLGVTVVMIVGLLQVLGGIVMIGILIYGAMEASA